MNSVFDMKKKVLYVGSTFTVIVIFISLFVLLLPEKENKHGETSDRLSLVNDIDATLSRSYYVNNDGIITFAVDKQYAMIERRLDSLGRTVEEFYYDENNEPVKQLSGHYGLRHHYNELDQDVEIIYLDMSGNPVMNTSGYAISVRSFNSDNQVIKEMYYDIEYNPVKASLGEGGVLYQYDTYGRRYLVTYVSSEGKPIENKMGYTSLLRIYNDNGSINTEFYLDNNNNVSIPHGFNGRRIIGAHSFFVNSEGRIVFDINNIIDNFPWLVLIVGFLLSVMFVVVSPKWSRIVFLVYLFYMLKETIFFRKPVNELNTELFWSYSQFLDNYQIRMEIIKNVMLFVPFGAFWYSAEYSKREVFFSLILSCMIELTQLTWHIGYFEIDDIISNSFGGFVGGLIAYCLYCTKAFASKKSNMKR